MKYAPLDLSKIDKSHVMPADQYYAVETKKAQICLHHTASGRGIDGDWTHWLNDPARVATPVIIGTDGTIFQIFQSKYWGHHLGIKPAVFTSRGLPADQNNRLNKLCIGIEIDAWGPLVRYDGAWRSYTGSKVPDNEVVHYTTPFKNIPFSEYFQKIGVVGNPAMAYHRYTDKQIYATAQLLQVWCEHYKIPKAYNESMWDVSHDALSGVPGIWTHVSYRADKNDCHPQPELIDMLKSI